MFSNSKPLLWSEIAYRMLERLHRDEPTTCALCSCKCHGQFPSNHAPVRTNTAHVLQTYSINREWLTGPQSLLWLNRRYFLSLIGPRARLCWKETVGSCEIGFRRRVGYRVKIAIAYHSLSSESQCGIRLADVFEICVQMRPMTAGNLTTRETLRVLVERFVKQYRHANDKSHEVVLASAVRARHIILPHGQGPRLLRQWSSLWLWLWDVDESVDDSARL